MPGDERLYCVLFDLQQMTCPAMMFLSISAVLALPHGQADAVESWRIPILKCRGSNPPAPTGRSVSNAYGIGSRSKCRDIAARALFVRDRMLFALRRRQPRDRRATPGLEGFDHVPVLQCDVDVVDAAHEAILFAQALSQDHFFDRSVL
jgi:hypothetical protein